MNTISKKVITVQTIVDAPVEKVWEYWSTPAHIVRWNNASVDWHTPRAENDLRPGGKFSSRMEARDGSIGFDFEGTYDIVNPFNKIAYTMSDGRKVEITFSQNNNQTRVVEKFEAEEENSYEMQQQGWQSILDNFKRYVENS